MTKIGSIASIKKSEAKSNQQSLKHLGQLITEESKSKPSQEDPKAILATPTMINLNQHHSETKPKAEKINQIKEQRRVSMMNSIFRL